VIIIQPRVRKLFMWERRSFNPGIVSFNFATILGWCFGHEIIATAIQSSTSELSWDAVSYWHKYVHLVLMYIMLAKRAKKIVSKLTDSFLWYNVNTIHLCCNYFLLQKMLRKSEFCFSWFKPPMKVIDRTKMVT